MCGVTSGNKEIFFSGNPIKIKPNTTISFPEGDSSAGSSKSWFFMTVFSSASLMRNS